MARSKYIYHIRGNSSGCIIASFTVKSEAHTWMVKSERNFDRFMLVRVRDGVCDLKQKFETKVDWYE
jgi:hypothetical protein